jgi:hypothetical protein
MIFLMHSHFDLKKSHFDSRNQVPDVLAIMGGRLQLLGCG